jgi:tetratricopeptide (TPR) repeat protein
MTAPSAPALFQKAVAAHQSGALDEAERLYRAVLAADSASRAARGNLAALCFHRGRFQDAADWLGQLLVLDPAQPGVLHNRASALANLGRFEDALADCDAALALDPAHLDAALTRAWTLEALGRRAEAQDAYAVFLGLIPEDGPRSTIHRAKALQGLDRDEEALALLDEAAAAAPWESDLAYARGLSLTKLKRLDEALAAYDRAIAARPDFASAHWNRARLLLAAGQAEAGWPLYDWRMRDPSLVAGYASFSEAPLWSGELDDLPGRTLLVQHEQGLGDTLQMLRYLPLLRAAGAKVVLAPPPALAPLAAPIADQVLLPGDVIPPHDLRVFAMSLPLALGAASGAPPPGTPYLKAPTEALADWAERLGPPARPRRIGLAWSGDPRHLNDHNRSLPLADLRPWLEADAQFHSLQAGYRDSDRAVLDHEPRLHDHAAALTDWGQTAALAAHMDLVITVDTAVAHLAGALGRPVWILLPWVADHRWGWEGAATPWYPTARLWRQPARGDWKSVVEAVGAALKAPPAV